MRVTVIVPVLYGEPQLGTTLTRLTALRDRLDLETLIVVDVPDPSREREARAANDPTAAEHGARAVYRIGERGFGAALRYAFAQATGDVMVPFMGDCSDDPETIVAMVGRVEGGCDVVAGSRYMRGGGVVGDTAKQRFSRWYSVAVRIAGGPPIHDISNAFKAYRREVVRSMACVADSFDVSVELTVRAARAGFRICEVPTVWTNRELGSSNFRIAREIRNYGRWLLFAAGGRLSKTPAPARPAVEADQAPAPTRDEAR